MDRSAEIRDRLQKRFAPQELEVRDDSALHVGHANEGRGHFSVRIISSQFSSLGRVERHRMVYAALGDLMQDGVHALSIAAFTPEETH
ncbi:MAG TPA: BolA family protein [Gammaproteobacteria bacterium]|jgi:BolA protein